MSSTLRDILEARNEPAPLETIASHPILDQVLTWWEGARNGGFPQKIDPLDLPPAALPYLMLVDLVGDDDASVRLAGTRACELYGGEMRGLGLADFFEPEDAALVLRDLHAVHDRGAPSLTHRSYVCVGEKYLSYTRLLLPIAGCGDRPKQVLKVLEPTTYAEV